MLERVEGIVLRDRDYGDSSKIIDVLTKQHGMISIMSKGCKKPKSPLCSVSNKFVYGNFEIYYKEGKLSVLTSVDIINNLFEIRKDMFKIGYVSYIMELTYQVLKQVSEDNISDIYDSFINSILKINEGYNNIVIKNILEVKYLMYLGVFPTLDKCSKCGRKEDIVTVSADSNGLLCKSCRTNEAIVKLDTIKYLRMYNYIDISKISKLNINEDTVKEIDKFLSDYYDKHTGLYFATKKFLDTIDKWR